MMKKSEEKFQEIENEIKADKRAFPGLGTRRIEIGNYKGGTGKSTVAVHLAYGLAQRGRKVLLIDTDPQGNATAMLGQMPFYSLADLMEGREFDDVVTRARPNLHLIGANAGLSQTENKMVSMPYGGEEILEDLLLEIEKSYDYVLIDTKPSKGLLNDNSKFYVNELCVAYELKPMTLEGLKDYINDFETIRKKLLKRYQQSKLKVKYILPTFYKNTLSAEKSLDKLNDYVKNVLKKKGIDEYHELRILEAIPERTIVSELPEYGLTVWEYDPKSPAAEALNKFVEEVIKDEPKKRQPK
ncbi:MAG TPA: ParA family protein [Pyrinomonadaceae bacterium]|nr:ParA family protein [Pyrinomonadaceae bacterium]